MGDRRHGYTADPLDRRGGRGAILVEREQFARTVIGESRIKLINGVVNEIPRLIRSLARRHGAARRFCSVRGWAFSLEAGRLTRRARASRARVYVRARARARLSKCIPFCEGR